MLVISEDDARIRTTFEGLCADGIAVYVEAEWLKGDAPSVRLRLIDEKEDGEGDGTEIPLDDCVPVESLPMAAIDTKILYGMRGDFDAAGAVARLHVAKACTVTARPTTRDEATAFGAGVIFTLHVSRGFRTTGFLRRRDALRYFPALKAPPEKE